MYARGHEVATALLSFGISSFVGYGQQEIGGLTKEQENMMLLKCDNNDLLPREVWFEKKKKKKVKLRAALRSGV